MKLRLTLSDVKSLLQKKIQERTSKGRTFSRTCYVMFGRNEEGVNFQLFKHSLQNNFGISMKDLQLLNVFQQLDKKGSGVISNRDLAAELMPPNLRYKLSFDERHSFALEQRKRVREKQH